MKIQPRQRLLEVWRATAEVSYGGKEWSWGGSRDRNCISDAEQLLCILGPATEIKTFKIDQSDSTADDVARALAPFGDKSDIPRVLVDVVSEYFETYTDRDTGSPIFAGDSYFAADGGEPADHQRSLDVVDAFAASIRLSLATIGFLKVYRREARQQEKLDRLEAAASRRLTAAMIGLLRSFTVNVFDVASDDGQNLCRTLRQGARTSDAMVVERFRRELREVTAGLRDLSLGSGPVSDLDNEHKLFDCGWSWGLVRDAPLVTTPADVGEQPHGIAEAAPYLYFTVVALECIEDLFSERTRILGLLDEEQQRLARSLQLRWDLTQSYWSKVARFGRRWPLEDLPWRTNDGVESDYLSLLVTSIVVKDLATHGAPEQEGARVGEVLEELASRGRITRRPLRDGDPALTLHSPGFQLELWRSDQRGGPRLIWPLPDFAPQLLKQALRLAGLLTATGPRTRLMDLADRVWEDHVLRRRIEKSAARRLWDHPAGAYPEVLAEDHEPPLSWYYTERVVECLVAANEFLDRPPQRSASLLGLATELLAEADHLYDRELLNPSAAAGPAMDTTLRRVELALRRSHEILGDKPGTAIALTVDVLRELDELEVARLPRPRVG